MKNRQEQFKEGWITRALGYICLTCGKEMAKPYWHCSANCSAKKNQDDLKKESERGTND